MFLSSFLTSKQVVLLLLMEIKQYFINNDWEASRVLIQGGYNVIADYKRQCTQSTFKKLLFVRIKHNDIKTIKTLIIVWITINILSFFRMRCREVTKGYGLPRQQFSDKNRCSFCCLEWTGQLKTKVWRCLISFLKFCL